MSLYGEYLDLLCANESRQSYVAMRSGLMEFYHQEPNGFSGITLGLGYVDLYSGNYTDSSLGMVRSYRPIFYAAEFYDILDEDDSALVNAGYLRSHVPDTSSFLPKAGTTYIAADEERMITHFQGWRRGIAQFGGLHMTFGNDGRFRFTADDMDETDLQMEAAGQGIMFSDNGLTLYPSLGSSLNIFNIEEQGTFMPSTGTDSPPSVNIGNPAYWLGRPDYWLKVNIGSFGNVAIPGFSIS
jgi:hypothetical protein